MMDILNILHKSCCAVDVQAKNKRDILRQLAECATRCDITKQFDPAMLEKALATREEDGSTGFGNQIAIPHARIEGLTDFVFYIVACRKGVNFDALDKQKVRLFFVILGPVERVNEHLQVLAFVSRTIAHTNVKEELLRAKSTNALYETFLRHTDIQPRETRERQSLRLMLINTYGEDRIYEVLEALLEEGIEGATILDSVGMGHYISNNPLFASFSGLIRGNRNSSKTVIAMVPEDSVDAIVSAIETITGNLDDCRDAMVLTLDMNFHKGNMNIV